MHAYLILGKNNQEIEERIEKLVKKLRVKTFDYPLAKIRDVRELGAFTKLKIDKPTAILIKGIEAASTEALNAFLKNLEEPQENIRYILTAASIKNLPPTILSRCQIIKVGGKRKLSKKEAEKIQSFLKKNEAEKLLFTSKIWGRERAIDFMENFILCSHLSLIKAKNGHLKIGKQITSANQTLESLKAYGNVQLQLTNFVLGLV